MDIYQLIYTFDGKSYIIYGVGRNECGELGVGNCLKVRNYIQLSRFSSLCHAPKFIYPQWKKFYIKNELNEIYFAGFEAISQQFISEFTLLSLPNHLDNNNKNSKLPHIELLSEGLQAKHTFIITQSQSTEQSELSMFVLGDNYRGQFGIGGMMRKYESMHIHNVTQKIGPLISGSIENIKMIKCGSSHTIFLTKDGLLYGCGSNTYSQCGYESIDNDRIYSPTIIDIKCMDNKTGKKVPVLIRDVCCGQNHNLCLSMDHKLYVFGMNEYGQIGPKKKHKNKGDHVSESESEEDIEMDPDETTVMLLPNRNQIIRPRLHRYFKEMDIESINCGADYSLCIDFKGNCWLFGDNRCGQIGNNQRDTMNDVDVPFLIQTYDELKDIRFEYGSCGYTHTILLSRKEPQQYIYVFGCNLHCECSVKMRKTRFIQSPYLLNKTEIFGDGQQYRINHVIAARCSTLIICEK